MSSPAFSSQVKTLLNSVLQPLGLEVHTTLAQRQREAKIRELTDKGHWTTPRYHQGLQLEPERWLEFGEEICAPYRADYEKFPRQPNGDGNAYYLDNIWFTAIDAEILYCLMRHAHPRRVVEVGSGFSTRVMSRAIQDGGLTTHITSIDPAPRTNIHKHTNEYWQQRVEETEPGQIIAGLSANDMLFIDSSHFVATGSDVTFLFLEVLPQLPAGVWVHIHDIFFPHEYPESWLKKITGLMNSI